jgi:choline dehydrogenase-like flavoprotein
LSISRKRNKIKKLPMKKIETDVVIVGSGAGGATVAKELAGAGKRILILEKGNTKGKYRQTRRLRNYFTNIDFLYSELTEKKVLSRNINVVYWVGTGGTTIVSTANFVRSLAPVLQSHGIDIEKEFAELERELKVTPYPEKYLGSGASKLLEAGALLGLKWEFMPRAIDFDLCRFCGECNLRCSVNAKWTASRYLDKAQKGAVYFLENADVKEVLSANGRVVGVRGRMNSGTFEVAADIVVLAAGAVETAVILINSGIERAGRKLFCHPYYVLYDSSDNHSYRKEPNALINREFLNDQSYMLANSNITRFERIYRRLPKPLKPNTANAMLGIMVKIKDDSSGRVFGDGRTHKVLTAADTKKVMVSLSMAEDILSATGVEKKHIRARFFSAVHPGGTAAIGDVVDANLQTEIQNCYVSDASVLPEASGLPPLLTIMALSKRLGKRLSSI